MQKISVLLAAISLFGCTSSQFESNTMQQYRLENQDKSGFLPSDFYFMFDWEEHPEFTIFNTRNNMKIVLESLPAYGVPNVGIRKDGYIHIFAMNEYFNPLEEGDPKYPGVTVYFYDAKMLAKPVVKNCRVTISIDDIKKFQGRGDLTAENLRGYDVEEYFSQNDFQIPGATCEDYKYRQD
jgi:hypothetical protein